MPSKQAVLELLQRDELLALVDKHEVSVANRKAKAGLVKALGSARGVSAGQVVAGLPVARLKALCAALALEAVGSKAVLQERLAAAEKKKAPAKKKASAPAKAVVKKKEEEEEELGGYPQEPMPANMPMFVLPESPLPPPSSAVAIRLAAQPIPETELLSQPLARGEDPLTVLAVQSKKCGSCKKPLEVRKCQVQKCRNMILVGGPSKVCADCLFERNTLSMTEFMERCKIETLCKHCGKPWMKAGAPSASKRA